MSGLFTLSKTSVFAVLSAKDSDRPLVRNDLYVAMNADTVGTAIALTSLARRRRVATSANLCEDVSL